MAHTIEYKRKKALKTLETMLEGMIDLHGVVDNEFIIGFKYMIKVCKRHINGTPLDTASYIGKLGDRL